MIRRYDAAIELIRHQDSVNVLASRGLATSQDRLGLAEAQEIYDRATRLERYPHFNPHK
jgi:hypothetical protein